MCFIYSSIVTRNLLPRRDLIVKLLAAFFWLIIAGQGVVGYLLSMKLKNDWKYAFILCTDPLLITLRFGPFLASVAFALVVLTIRYQVENAPQYLAIEEARKRARLNTIQRLQYITTYFVFSCMYLIGWDLIRFLKNKHLPPEQVNCFGVMDNRYVNNLLWFFGRFFASQSDMYVVIINFWKSFKSRPSDR